MKIQAEIVNGKCPTCEEYTVLVSLTPEVFRCMTCGTDLQQHVNGKISYIPHITSKTLVSEVEKYFDGQES
jgi:ribosomal protein S27E